MWAAGVHQRAGARSSEAGAGATKKLRPATASSTEEVTPLSACPQAEAHCERLCIAGVELWLEALRQQQECLANSPDKPPTWWE
jgi:hypothetical protein